MKLSKTLLLMPRRWPFRVFVGGMLTSTAPNAASPQSWEFRPAASAPVEWGTFATLLKSTFESSLKGDSTGAGEFWTAFNGAKRRMGVYDTNVVISAWVGVDGAVTRVAFASLGSASADNRLERLLTSKAVSAAPPPDMLQPIRVRLVLSDKRS